MLSTHCIKRGQATKSGTSGDTSIPFGDLAGWDTPSVHVFVCGVMETEGERQLHHLLTVSLCPYVQQHYLSSLHREWDAWNSCWNWVCVCVCVLIHMSNQRNYSSKWELQHAECQHWFGDWILSQLGKEVPPMEARETLCLSFLSIGWGCDGSWCLCQLSKHVHLSCFINIGQTTSNPGNNTDHKDKEIL